MKLRNRRPVHFIDLSTESESDEETVPLKPRTPRKQKPKPIDENDISPAKQKKTIKSPQTPSTMLDKLELNSPEKKHISKQLFETSESGFICARKALHSTLPKSLPARENELERLRGFITGHLEKGSAGSLYISGPPGTGKTACLSLILQEENVSGVFLGLRTFLWLTFVIFRLPTSFWECVLIVRLLNHLELFMEG